MEANRQLNDVEILRNGKGVGRIYLREKDWSEVNYVDYFDVDKHYGVTEEFRVVHGAEVCRRMQAMVDAWLDGFGMKRG